MHENTAATPEDIAVLVRLAGLTLTHTQFEELLDAYAHVEAMLGRLRRARPFDAEPAHIFDPMRFLPPDA